MSTPRGSATAAARPRATTQGRGDGGSEPKSSPSADRVVCILDFLAAHPREAFTFSELRRHLGMSNGTLHALLTSLANSSYVRRSPKSLSYSLGPALFALGTAAREGYHIVDDLQPEMERLSAELHVACHATVPNADEMVVVARTGPDEPFGRRVRVGERVPLVPPLGAAYIAWSEPAAIDAYLARADPPLRPTDRQRCLEALAGVRRRGYSIALDPATRHRVAELLGEGRRRRPRSGLHTVLAQLAHEEYLLRDVEPGTTYDAMSILAPVFDPAGSVLALLAIANFEGSLSGDQLGALAARLCRATEAVTALLGGRAPVER